MLENFAIYFELSKLESALKIVRIPSKLIQADLRDATGGIAQKHVF